MVASRPFDLWRLEPRFRVASPLRSSSVAADEFIKRMLMSCLCLALTRRRRGTAVAAADDDDQDLGRRRRNIFPPKRRPMKNGRKKKQTERTEGNTSHCVGRHGYWLGGSCGAFNLQMALSDSGAFGFNWNRLRARRKVKGGGEVLGTTHLGWWWLRLGAVARWQQPKVCLFFSSKKKKPVRFKQILDEPCRRQDNLWTDIRSEFYETQ